jgi:hypothetical protein
MFGGAGGIHQFMGSPGHHHWPRRKPSLSEHQKQIRFFMWLSIIFSVVVALALFLLMNWSSISPR